MMGTLVEKLDYLVILVFRRPVGLFMVNCVFVSVIKELEKGVYN